MNIVIKSICRRMRHPMATDTVWPLKCGGSVFHCSCGKEKVEYHKGDCNGCEPATVNSIWTADKGKI